MLGHSFGCARDDIVHRPVTAPPILRFEQSIQKRSEEPADLTKVLIFGDSLIWFLLKVMTSCIG